jgi:hypothetical protein
MNSGRVYRSNLPGGRRTVRNLPGENEKTNESLYKYMCVCVYAKKT